MRAYLPNLELIEYKTTLYLRKAPPHYFPNLTLLLSRRYGAVPVEEMMSRLAENQS